MQLTSSSSFLSSQCKNVAKSKKGKSMLFERKKYEDCQMLSYHVFDKQFLVTVIISWAYIYMKISLSYSLDICLRTYWNFNTSCLDKTL